MGGIQEEKQNINSLQSKVHDVKSYIKHRSDRQENRSIVKLEQDQRQVTNSFELSNLNTIILDQNSQHSFGEEIYIPLTIPDSLANAIVYIYDDSDQVIKTIVLNDRSKTTLHVYSEKLSSGVYSYSLIAEGQAIETKKLIYVR